MRESLIKLCNLDIKWFVLLSDRGVWQLQQLQPRALVPGESEGRRVPSASTAPDPGDSLTG